MSDYPWLLSDCLAAYEVDLRSNRILELFVLSSEELPRYGVASSYDAAEEYVPPRPRVTHGHPIVMDMLDVGTGVFYLAILNGEGQKREAKLVNREGIEEILGTASSVSLDDYRGRARPVHPH